MTGDELIDQVSRVPVRRGNVLRTSPRAEIETLAASAVLASMRGTIPRLPIIPATGPLSATETDGQSGSKNRESK